LKHKIEPVIYLDLDGVCVDFVNASLKASGFDPEEIARKWRRNFKGEYQAWVVSGISRENYWGAIALQGEGFWRDLKAYDWYEQLYEGLSKIAPVIFLSSSTRTPSCLSGKLHWLQDRFGVTFIFPCKSPLSPYSSTVLLPKKRGREIRFIFVS